MIGTYQHCGESHLQRYVTEFDFRYNGRKLNDNERRDAALRGIEGKRLTYRRINTAAIPNRITTGRYSSKKSDMGLAG